MGFLTAYCTQRGGRKENEDAVLLEEMGAVTLAAVADGLGGHACGAVASQTAVTVLAEQLDHMLPVDEERVRAAFSAINNAILARQPQLGKMKSTLSMLISDSETLILAHTGDTRTYFFQDGVIQYQSMDHSVSQMAVLAGEITAKEIRFHPDRSFVLHALGSEGEPHIEMRRIGYPLKEGDAFLLCSDGFWEYVLEEEMTADLLEAASASEWLGAMLTRLSARIGEGCDNYSAAALIFKEDIP